MHTGDMGGPRFIIGKYELPNEDIDIAFVRRRVLKELWEFVQAKYVVPMHFENPSPDNPDAQEIASSFSNAIWFYEEMQKISIQEFLEGGLKEEE